MDILDRVLTPGRDLLGRVDATLAAFGAPDDHEIWPLLRRLGALPSDALEYVAALRVDPLAALALELRARSDGYAGHRARLDAALGTVSWRGPAREAFANRCSGFAEYLGDAESANEPSMSGRLVALMSYLDDVIAWVGDTRAALAVALAAALGSAEAVRLRGAPGQEAHMPVAVYGIGAAPSGQAGPATAAATVGVAVLRPVDAAMRAGHDLYRRCSPRLGELVFRGPAVAPPGGGETRVQL